MIDNTDKLILELLKNNSRAKVKEIADIAHMSAPAISQRIIKLEDTGIISQFTININYDMLELPVHHFIHTTMNKNSHSDYLNFLDEYPDNIISHYRTSGDSCYIIEARFKTMAELTDFLTKLNIHANCKLNTIINVLK